MERTKPVSEAKCSPTKNGQAYLVAEPVFDGDAAAVEEAVRNCPTMALSLQR